MLEEKSEPPGKRFSKTHRVGEWEMPLLPLLKRKVNNRIFFDDGLAKILPKLNLKVHSQIEECCLLWNRFSKKESLFDLWDFRVSWLKGYRYTPYFYTIDEEDKPLAVLPLWYNEKKKRYEWFGSDWMEDNSFFAQEPLFIPLLLELLSDKARLNAIEDVPASCLNLLTVEADDEKYVKDLAGFKTMADYLAALKKKRRYNLKRDYLRIKEKNPQIEFIDQASFRHFKDIIKLSKTRFNGTLKDQTDLIIKERVETYRQILKNSGLYKVKFIKVYIRGDLAAVDLILTYRKRYYTLKGANDLARFSGLGNFMVYIEFKDAIETGFSLIDSLQIDYGWKHRFFDSKKLWQINKG